MTRRHGPLYRLTDDQRRWAQEDRRSFWDAVDSLQGMTPHFGSGPWGDQREAGCLALKSTGERCTRWVTEDHRPFCPFHFDRAADWFMARATDQQLRSAQWEFERRYQDMANMLELANTIVHMAPKGERVYFYELVGQNLVKIGTSVKPEVRVADFLRGRGCTFPPDVDTSAGQLMGHIAGGRAIEGGLHAAYRPLRVIGEWFRLTPELREDIEAMLSDDLAESA